MPNEEVNSKQNTTEISGKKSLIVLLVIVLLIAAAFLVWYKLGPEKVSFSPTTPTTSKSTEDPDVKSDADLKKLEDEVNKVDIDGLSKDLELNDKDASEY